MAETIQQKAERFLTTGRLTVVSVDADALIHGTRAAIVAKARGDSGEVYDLGYDLTKDEWRCGCEANSKFKRECSHLKALKLVTVKPKEENV